MIITYCDYEQITPDIVEKIKAEFVSSSEYVEGILARRGAKLWAESVAGLYALYKAMTEAKMDVRSAVIKRTELGKPYFENSAYYFNISHSCGRAVCVISEREVGVDIEFEKKIRNFDLLAKNFFSEGERKRYNSAKNKAEEFYRIWTRKEALVKEEGNGIEYKELCKIDTYAYPNAEFEEFKRGGYVISVCLAK